METGEGRRQETGDRRQELQELQELQNAKLFPDEAKTLT
jgi:hypothetical protein